MPKPYLVPETDEMRRLLALDAERKGNDVIGVSPWVQQPGDEPHRAVLRDCGDQYVVHTQVIPLTNEERHKMPFFYAGHYFDKRIDDALARAWTRFDNVARRWMGINGDDT